MKESTKILFCITVLFLDILMDFYRWLIHLVSSDRRFVVGGHFILHFNHETAEATHFKNLLCSRRLNLTTFIYQKKCLPGLQCDQCFPGKSSCCNRACNSWSFRRVVSTVYKNFDKSHYTYSACWLHFLKSSLNPTSLCTKSWHSQTSVGPRRT